MKKSDINTLMSEELKELHRLIEEVLEIYEPIFLERATSAFSAALFSDLGSEYKKQAEKAHSEFGYLCQALPHVPRECLRSLSMAYGFFFDSPFEDETEIEQLRTLMVVSHYRGMAIGQIGMAAGEMQSANTDTLRKKRLSEAGAKGALARLQPYKQLKSWVLKKAEGLGSSKAVSRKLASQLPPHLADISDDPSRFIYETLLSRKKPN